MLNPELVEGLEKLFVMCFNLDFSDITIDDQLRESIIHMNLALSYLQEVWYIEDPYQS